MNQELSELLHKHGASMIGFAYIKDKYNLPISRDNIELEDEVRKLTLYPYAISIMVHLTPRVVKSLSNGPTMEYYEEYLSCKDKIDNLAILAENFIKEKGYKAHAQTVNQVKEFGIYQTIMPHKTVAVSAGLGWIGKSALFLNEEYGSAVRLTSVLTDAPFNTNQVIISSKCGNCMKCATACPAKAITGKEWAIGMNREDIYDPLACRKKARELASISLNKEVTLCGKCIEVCPYTRNYTNKKLENS